MPRPVASHRYSVTMRASYRDIALRRRWCRGCWVCLVLRYPISNRGEGVFVRDKWLESSACRTLLRALSRSQPYRPPRLPHPPGAGCDADGSHSTLVPADWDDADRTRMGRRVGSRYLSVSRLLGPGMRCDSVPAHQQTSRLRQQLCNRQRKDEREIAVEREQDQ